MRRRTDLIATTLIALLSLSAVALADTISYADAVTTLAKDCGADIRTFCSGLNLGNNRIQDCLQKNASKVSPVCTSTLASVTASIRTRQAAQANYSKICAQKIHTTCKGTRGDGNILACLIKANRIVGEKCNQAITDAGWR